MKLLITGGAGFIGSAFVRHVLMMRDDIVVIVVDKLTYAGNLDNLGDVAEGSALPLRPRRHLRGAGDARAVSPQSSQTPWCTSPLRRTWTAAS